MNKFFLEVLHEEAIPEMSLSELLGGAGDNGKGTELLSSNPNTILCPCNNGTCLINIKT